MLPEIASNTGSRDRLQARLLGLAALFIILQASAITLAPAARARSFDEPLHWGHWLWAGAWLLTMGVSHLASVRYLPARDPFLLPVAALLTGWGGLTIWRLFPYFGQRQALWLLVIVAIFIPGMRLPSHLDFLRRYKYVWITTGLLLTALTLILGTNPQGEGPRMWLGCCGLYFQPSEPLKLLFIVYLAAYLAGLLYFPRQDGRGTQTGEAQGQANLIPLLAPTLILFGLSLALWAPPPSFYSSMR